MFPFFFFLLFFRFYEYIFYKPSRNLTYPFGGTKGFKGLVAYAKCNVGSYESESSSSFIIFYCFARGRAKDKCGVYVWSQNIVIYTLIYLAFVRNKLVVLEYLFGFFGFLWDIILIPELARIRLKMMIVKGKRRVCTAGQLCTFCFAVYLYMLHTFLHDCAYP